MNKPIEAIPTVYRGVQMRSRAEADTARLLDLLNMPWQYESTSVLLPDGRHYRPDFILPPSYKLGKPSWLEVRGYDQGDSYEQIRSVAKQVAGGLLPCETFATVTSDAWLGQIAASFVGMHEHVYYAACESEWFLAVCHNCRRGRIMLRGLARALTCRSCYFELYSEAYVKIVDGYICLRHSESWKTESAVRVRDIPANADMIALFDGLVEDQLGDTT